MSDDATAIRSNRWRRNASEFFIAASVAIGIAALASNRPVGSHTRFLEHMAKAPRYDYVVRRGETLSGYAVCEDVVERERVAYAQFVDTLNRVSNSRNVRIGESLMIRAGDTLILPDINGDTYVGCEPPRR